MYPSPLLFIDLRASHAARSFLRSVPLVAAFALAITSGCAENIDGPAPTVSGLDPSLVCNVQLTTEITIRGTELSPLAIDAATDDPRLAIPDVTLRRVQDLSGDAVAGESVTLDNDPYNPDASRVRWIDNTQMAFDVYPELGLQPGLYEIEVTNRNGKQAVMTQAITAVPRPAVSAVEPDLTCLAQGMRSITITGESLVSVDGALPTVTIGGQMYPVDSLDGCAPLPGPIAAEICTSAQVTIPADDLNTGDHDVQFQNPDPAGCQSEEPLSLFVASEPTILTIEPLAICENNQPAELVVIGEDFLRLDDGADGFIEPEILIDGMTVEPTWDPGSCAPVESMVATGEVCASFTVPVPPGGFNLGSHDMTITNPAPADCSALSSFTVAEPPIVTDVIPFAVCAEGDTFTVLGTGFIPGAEILVDGSPVSTMYVSDTELTGTIQNGFTANLYDVSVSNGVGCESNLLTSALDVVSAPIVYFVDPPNVYSLIDMRITVWASGIYGVMPMVGIRATGSMDPLTMLANPAYDGQNRIQADLPAGLPPGDYDVVVIDDPCDGELQNVLHLVDTTTVHISSIEPLFGVEGERTGITIRSEDPTPAGFENFEPTPRAYLNPIGGGVATEVQAVSYLGDRQIDGVVPDGLPPGEYEVVVVNPDGDVGVLATPRFRILPVADPPPIINDLVPGLVTDSPGQNVDIRGANFPTAAVDIEVTADCRDPQGMSADMSVTATIGTPTSTLIPSTWDMSGLSGYVCVVRVTNLDNNTFADFSAISVANSSDNLNDFIASQDMLEARRAAAGAAVRLNAQSRFLFAIGGDQGDDAINPVVRHDSVESVPIDPFGALSGAWSLQRNALPETRAFISATVANRHVYVAGGRVGAAPGVVDNAILRAYLLDPFEAPSIRSLNLYPTESNGLDAGIWYYRVSAVMKSQNMADPTAPENNNPDGEGLPSEPLVLQLPLSSLNLEFTWQGIPGADRYIIYRTTAPNGVAGQEVYLAEVPHMGADLDLQTFLDTGVLDNSAETRTPLPLGSLGTWHEVATMTTEREGAAIVAAPDPVDPSIHYLYVIGGRDSTGTPVASYEWATLTDMPSNIQAVGTVQLGAETLPDGRWQLGAVYVDSTRGPIPDGQMWLYALAGLGNAGNADNDVIAFPVDTADGGGNDDGALGAPIVASSTGPSLGGYAYVAGNNFLHVIGGQSAQPSNGGRKSEITGAPTLSNWSNGTNLLIKRYLLATARESAFIFLLGGQTDVEFATRQTERTNF